MVISTRFLPPGDIEGLQSATREQAQAYYVALWRAAEQKGDYFPTIAELAKHDRFFLLTWMLDRQDADRDWIYARCREVEAAPDGYLDLWAREHYKSTIITFAGIIQAIINDPELTVGIFSVTYSRAVEFIRQIKREFEQNQRLKLAYPHIFYEHPEKESPTWSEQNGIVVKRRSNPREATVTAHGLIEGLPAGPHYGLRVYDDVITDKEVTTPEIMRKAMDMWRQSQNLGKEGGRRWHAGTRYHFNDPYSKMIYEKLLVTRIHPATSDGSMSGKPVLVSPEYMAERYKDLGPYLFSCQWLLDPVADEAQAFKKEWIEKTRWEPGKADGFNVYVTVDPANEKKKNSDYTVIWVIGLGHDRNYYVMDCIRDRMNLTERADALFDLQNKYLPIAVGYEKYGIQADIEHFEDRMKRENNRFTITPLGGNLRKEDRIRMLIPPMQQGRFWFPEAIMYKEKRGNTVDLMRIFVEQELDAFPVSIHDDLLDALARILDPELGLIWPKGGVNRSQSKGKPDRWEQNPKTPQGSWMSRW